MAHRNEDNFTNSYDYIVNQLFARDYNDSDDFTILKMKLSCLDGPISDEEAGGSELEGFKLYYPDEKIVVSTEYGRRIYECQIPLYTGVRYFDYKGDIDEWKVHHTYYEPISIDNSFYNAGSWGTYTHTTFGDIVKYGNENGVTEVFKCNTTFTSGLEFSDANFTRVYYTDWAPNTYYPNGSYVAFSNRLWQANSSHTSGEDFVTYPASLYGWLYIGDATLSEDDLDAPKDHWSSLLNELVMFDLYVRTANGVLNTGELNFTEEKEKRINNFNKWLEKRNTITGVTNKDFDYPYRKRPPLLTDAQFLSLYMLYVEKRIINQQFGNAMDIIFKVCNDCIDIDITEQESKFKEYEFPVTAELPIIAAGAEKKEENDRYYRQKMEDYRDEMLNITKYFYDSIVNGFSEYSAIANYSAGDCVKVGTDYYVSNETQTGVAPNGTWTQLLSGGENVGMINFCQTRPDIDVIPPIDLDTHSGIISAGDGFRYEYLKIDGSNTTFDQADLTEANRDAIELNYDLNEWGSGPFTDPYTSVGFKYVAKFINADEGAEWFTVIGDYTDLTGTGEEPGNLTKGRFDVLDERWKTLNRLREDEIMCIGTRAIIESMVTVDIPDLKEDYVDHYQDKKDQKRHFLDTLVEDCTEFI